MGGWLRQRCRPGASTGWIAAALLLAACGGSGEAASGGVSPPPRPSASVTGSEPAVQPGSFPVGFFAPDFIGPARRTFSEQFVTQVDGHLEVGYPAGSSSPSSGHPGGAQARLAIAAGPRLRYTLTYQIRFPVGFQWVRGGKLPGLCGGACGTRWHNGPGGWAARFMWRAGGAGEVLLSAATTTGFGADLGLGDWHFQADGGWHTLSEQVTMNTPGQPDGSIEVSYDGIRVAALTGLVLRAAGDTEEIDSLIFSTFFGGSGSSWAPTAAQHIDFRGFAVR